MHPRAHDGEICELMADVIPLRRNATERESRGSGAVPVSDGVLVARVIAGEAGAWDALARRHLRGVAGLVTRLLGDRQDADDVVQDAFVVAFERLRSLRDHDAFRPWLMQIAVCRARNLIRRRSLQRALGLLSGVDPVSLEALAAPTTSEGVRANLGAIDLVLRSLPANQRVAWMLRYVEGNELTEVASLCDCSLATAKRRIRAAHERVTALVEVEDLHDA